MQQSIADGSLLVLAEMPAWVTTVWSYVLIILGFSLVVFVHELGHFLAAKWAKVKVERFAIGFGRELFGFTRGETRYSFNVLPLGGYVKMLGQEDFVVDKSGELKVKENPDSFTSKPVGKRMVIVCAGVVMNLIFAAIVFTIVNMVGLLQPPSVAAYVVPDSPAGRAGLLPGDKILEMNGTKIMNFADLTQRIVLSDPDEVLVMTVERDGKIVSPSPEIRPEYIETSERRQIGIAGPENRRVGELLLKSPDSARTNELKPFDEIHEMIVEGKSIKVEDIGVVRRQMMEARGAPVQLVVKRPKNPDDLKPEMLIEFDPEIETNTVTVEARAVWLPLPYDDASPGSASLLGLVPRLTVLSVLPNSSFGKAGVENGDVITRIGKYEFPTYSEMEDALKEAGTTGAEIEVRRRGVKHATLTPAAVDFCIDHREACIRPGLANPAHGREAVRAIAAEAGLPEDDITSLTEALASVNSPDGWRKWFENIDIVVLKPIIPIKPFALMSDLPPKVDANIQCLNEDRVVVADVVRQFGESTTPAAEAGLERGAVILSVDGWPMRNWSELSQAFQRKAGERATIEYRLVDKIATTTFDVPNCVQAALNLGIEDRIIKIDGKSSCMVTRKDPKDGTDRTLPYALPDWRAAEQLLKDAVGKTVTIEYVTVNGERKTGTYTVTPDGTDPWIARVLYFPFTFGCYSLFEKHAIANPIEACAAGIKQAYRSTVYTVQTLYHMLLTRNVGLSNVSGPLGIANVGAKVSQSGLTALLFFLGLISANLAVINFLPLPIVDGGLFLFLILEKVRGEPVSIKMQVATQLLGIALIATVFILVTYQDIVRMVVGT